MIILSEWQSEYIKLIYGLAFVVLASVCFSMSRNANRRLPWVWLGLFGVIQGMLYWTLCLITCSNHNVFFPFVKTFLLVFSFICLAEFGRGGIVRVQGREPGRLILIPFFTLAVLAVALRTGSMQEALLYLLGLAGGLPAAWALLLASRDNGTRSGRWLRTACAAMGLYALLAGFSCQTAAHIIGQFDSETILNTFSFYLKAIKIFFILTLSAAVWAYSQAQFREDTGGTYHIARSKNTLLTVAVLIIFLCSGWTLTRYLEYNARDNMQEEGRNKIDALSNYLLDELAEADHAAMVIAGDNQVAAALLSSSPGNVERANLVLDRYHEVLEAPVCYLVDIKGNVIASSNRNDPDSYVGHNYGFRTYFRQALAGETGRCFALGMTSGVRGYYTSCPVRDGQYNIVGVAVVKRNLEGMEAAFQQYSLCFLADTYGIVFMSSRPDMLYMSLWPLNEEIVQALANTRQFGSSPFQAIGLQYSADGRDIVYKGHHYIQTSRLLNSEGWSVVLMSPTADMRAAWLPGLFLTLFLSILMNLFFVAKQRSTEGTTRLSASEENYRSIFNGVNEGIFVHEIPGGKIIDANQKTCEMYGCTREEILKSGLGMFSSGIPPYTNEEAKNYINKAAAGEPQLFDWLAKDIKGNLLWIEIILKKVTLGGREHVLAVFRNINERKQAEETLKESEDKYRTIFETTGAGTFIVEEDTTISLVNREFERLSGYDKEELEGKKSWTEFAAAENLEMMKDYHCRRRIDPFSAPRNYEFRFVDRHGVVKDVFLSISMIPGTKMSVASLVDISERKLALQALQEKSLFLQRLIDTIPNPIFYKDTNGLYQGCNKAYEEYTGLTKEEIIGKTAYDIYTRELAQKYHEMDLALFREPGVQVYEYYFMRVDGSRRDVIFNKATYYNSDGSVAGLLGVMVDITERKKAEEALRASEERFYKIFNASPSIMSITTYSEGRFIVANERFLKILGYSIEEIIGCTAEDIRIWVKPGRAEIMKMLQENGLINNLECTLRKKSGEMFTSLYSAEIVYFNGEQHILSAVNDITERKRLEEEMARLERLNLIGEMAAGIGHEIRNPMTTVRGLLQLLGSKKDSVQYKEYYDLMIDELDRANTIITEFLSLAKNRTVSKKMLDLNYIVEALFPLIQADAMRTDKFIQLEVGDIPDLLLDEKEIRQLILNLVRNGLEAMLPGGRITIKTFEQGEDVVLSVQDEGKGIEQGDLEKLGTPFFTTKDSGTGLGLAVCYSIAARHNASIRVETGPTGTTFYVVFNP